MQAAQQTIDQDDHLQQQQLITQHPQPLCKSSLQKTAMMTRSQLMARLQQLDPSFFPATRQLTQVLQQKHQQLWTLQQQVDIDHLVMWIKLQGIREC
jgi:hypothetical protein